MTKEYDTQSSSQYTANEKWSYRLHVYDPIKAGSIDGTDVIPHDHGIVRALCANYQPNKSVQGDPDYTIFVGRLDRNTQDETFKTYFEKYGELKYCRLVRNIITGESNGYGFIEFWSRSAMLEVLYEEHHKLDGANILVDKECERNLPNWIPRRLGGGFSGKKESGQLRFGGKLKPFKKPINLLPKASELEAKPSRKTHDGRLSRRDHLSSSSHHHHSKRNYHDTHHHHRRHHSRSDSDKLKKKAKKTINMLNL